MKLKPLALLCAFFLSSCAASYHPINPPALSYLSNSNDKSVSLDYKYNLLPQKYAKKETKFSVKLVAVKLTNNSGRDLIFGKDIKLTYGNGSEAVLMENQQVYSALRQKNEYYLFYLILTAATINTTTNGQQTSSIPIGYALGPGLTATNLLVADAANKTFNDELLKYNILGTTIKNGTTVYGLVGINSANFEGLKVKVE
ncbi:hypothetical protein [Mucilaginibacter sp.]|uniref:hypothetical protein n=1 Tax=Mucilaginibacter sp. TaxID=1882438 RepID=UPI00284384B2|nr:hypothetical protein [Mucilaginibacter sp.]MDR3693419.1 hypothetical protein [Mucilaginibacter sp.]